MENTINIEVGRGYIMTAYQYSDDADKYKIVLRHADGREVCTMCEWCYGIEYHMGETSKIMKRIIYLLGAIEDEDGNIELLTEWVLSTMKYWGSEMYEVLYEEFKGIIEGIIGCEVQVQDSEDEEMQVLVDRIKAIEDTNNYYIYSNWTVVYNIGTKKWQIYDADRLIFQGYNIYRRADKLKRLVTNK